MTDEITRTATLKATPMVWFDHIVVDLFRQFRVSFIPPLMVYLAAGISGLTAIVGTFFVKEYLGLSASYLAGLAFWAGLPWTLKIPLGHLVDLWWRRKEWLVYLGALLIACGLLIMIGLVLHTDSMGAVISVEYWYVLSVLLAPTGYVVQDVVADAMTVEAVSTTDEQGQPIDDEKVRRQHTTMQTLGRVAIIGGSLLVAGVNVIYFDNMDTMSVARRAQTYGFIYQLALLIPLVSVAGVTLGKVIASRKIRSLRRMGFDASDALTMVHGKREETQPNWWLFGGSIVFVAFSAGVGLSNLSGSQEVVFAGAMAIVIFLMHRLLLELPSSSRRELIGTAVIIFVFRAIPSPGAGLTWFEIDELGFDQQFLAVLSMLTSTLTLVGMLVLRPLMATKSIAWVVVVLSLAFGLLSIPNIGLFYGVHHWTTSWSQGVIDARTIALMDTMLESPLGQIAMIPMLAWIARSAPTHLKATFFAVMASFTNLALSASSLGTRYLNEWRTVTREVRDPATNAITVTADYGELGSLLISVAVIGLLTPLLTVGLVQASRWRTRS